MISAEPKDCWQISFWRAVQGSDRYLLNSPPGDGPGHFISSFLEFKLSESFALPSFFSPLEPPLRQVDSLPGVPVA